MQPRVVVWFVAVSGFSVSVLLFVPLGGERPRESGEGKASMPADVDLVISESSVLPGASGRSVDKGYARSTAPSPIGRDTLEVPPGPEELALAEVAPSETFLATGSIDALLRHPLFKERYGQEVLDDPRFQAKFGAALVELRLQRSKLYVQRDDETWKAVQESMQSGYVPGSRPRDPGELGAIIMPAQGASGWVPAPAGSAAYDIDATLQMWRISATELLLNLKHH